MLQVLLVIHIFITLALVSLVLLQRSEGGVFGMGGGSSMGGLFTSRGATNVMTKTTAVFATMFIVSCIVLAVVGGVTISNGKKSLFEETGTQTEQPQGDGVNIPTPSQEPTIPAAQ